MRSILPAQSVEGRQNVGLHERAGQFAVTAAEGEHDLAMVLVTPLQFFTVVGHRSDKQYALLDQAFERGG